MLPGPGGRKIAGAVFCYPANRFRSIRSAVLKIWFTRPRQRRATGKHRVNAASAASCSTIRLAHEISPRLTCHSNPNACNEPDTETRGENAFNENGECQLLHFGTSFANSATTCSTRRFRSSESFDQRLTKRAARASGLIGRVGSSVGNGSSSFTASGCGCAAASVHR